MSSKEPPERLVETGSHVVDYWFSRGLISVSAYRGAKSIITGSIPLSRMGQLNILLEDIDNIE